MREGFLRHLPQSLTEAVAAGIGLWAADAFLREGTEGVGVAVAVILLVAVVLATGRTLWDEFGGDLDT